MQVDELTWLLHYAFILCSLY